MQLILLIAGSYFASWFLFALVWYLLALLHGGDDVEMMTEYNGLLIRRPPPRIDGGSPGLC